jgi:hypothetical protein
VLVSSVNTFAEAAATADLPMLVLGALIALLGALALGLLAIIVIAVREWRADRRREAEEFNRQVFGDVGLNRWKQ